MTEPGEVTTSDHFPIVFKHSTTPFLFEKPKKCKTHMADWDLFKLKLDTQINVTNINVYNIEQLEDATVSWIKAVKNAIDLTIPKSSYQHIYQLK